MSAFGGGLVVSGVGELLDVGQTFEDIETFRMSEEAADYLAERTRGLRALHGGRIVGLVPSATNEWTDIDAVVADRAAGKLPR